MCLTSHKRMGGQEADKKRRAAFKARVSEARRKARFEKGRPQRDVRMSTLVGLLDAVLEIEPWNSARHVSGRAAAWGDCGRRAGLLKDKGKANAHKTVQQRVYRLARQLNDSTSGFPWKWYPEVTERVVKVAAKLRVDSDLKGTLGPDRMQGLVEHRASNPATPERPRAIAEQHQQLQGPEVPGASYELQVALRSFVAAAERASPSAMTC